MAVGIEAEMEFNRTLGLSESSPGENRQSKLDRGGIEQIDLSLELELMLGCTCLASL
jgi:hypothetical protein